MAKKCSSFASRARNVVQIEQPTQTEDALGGTLKSWATLAATVWAIIEPKGGRESFYHQQVQTPHTHKITIRYIAGLMPPSSGCKCRVSYGSHKFNIRGIVNVDEQNQYLELLCEEDVAQ